MLNIWEFSDITWWNQNRFGGASIRAQPAKLGIKVQASYIKSSVQFPAVQLMLPVNAPGKTGEDNQAFEILLPHERAGLSCNLTSEICKFLEENKVETL